MEYHTLLVRFSLLLLFSCAAVAATEAPGVDSRRLAPLGPGDTVAMQVFGQPDMSTTLIVGDDGTLRVPLAGPVRVLGLSPVDAARQVEKALKEGQFLRDPQVTLSVGTSSSQRVSVLGEVHQPGRYSIDPSMTAFDLLAQAGGVTETGGDVIYITRVQPDGTNKRFAVRKIDLPSQTLQGGDSIEVPRADQFYIYGEVTSSKMYRIEPGMTVIQAIAMAGGITPRGSERRVDIKRKEPGGDFLIIHPKPSDPVLPDDVIHVKESIF